jgi:shikimate kinase
MIRSANAVESSICEPPKPRLTTLDSGKSCAKVFHSRMEELPTNTIVSRGGGLVLSAASKAWISASHFDGSAWVCAPSDETAKTTLTLQQIPDVNQAAPGLKRCFMRGSCPIR